MTSTSKHRASLAVAVAMLAGCASGPGPQAPEERKGVAPPGCSQSEWQAETAPVINKRMGPDGLDKYEADCP
ncbi:hypothetical protein [Pseudomonas sp. nanlin1]|uniref:hypothetical protein n=1 Tax=Pseudomonas sp. nanlin1 TaxID=3040605 RepID=UPI00388F8A1A